MAWNIHEIRRKRKKYIALKKNYRVGKEVKSTYIYLGALRVAVKILADLQTKPLIDEKEISYSGEMILSEIARSIHFKQILERYLGSGQSATVLQNIIILRTLFPESKRKLVLKRLEYSILKDSTDLKYLEEVYRFMDKAYKHLGDILYDAIRIAVKRHSLDLEYLIIDGTRIKIYKDKETDLVRFGFSGKERRDLPQVNLVLGVNNQQVPLFVNPYPGSTHDVEMFQDFIKRINSQYQDLTRGIKEKFMVFDQGNVNKKNVKYLREIKKQGIYFISMLRTNSARRFIREINKADLKLIYSKGVSKDEKSMIYGKMTDEEVYGKKSRVLVCYSPAVREQKCKTLDDKLETIKQKVESGVSAEEIRELIGRCNLKRALQVVKRRGKLKLMVKEEDLKIRKERYGFFTLFTDHLGLSAEKVINIYKGRKIVEEGFRALKSNMEIAPVYHWKDRRIETHTVLVVYGYLLLSLLRALLKTKGLEHSFQELKETICLGNAVEGFYEHERLKSRLCIWRPIKLREELEEIFKALKIKVPRYDVKEVIPTDFRAS